MRFICLLLAMSSLGWLQVNAQKIEKVRAEYVYHAPENQSLEEAKRIALERAQIQAIADAFGTVVSQSNFTSVANRDGKSDVDFFSLGGSEVKGEWIETIGEPEYTVTYEEGILVVKAVVDGRIREIVMAKPEFDAKVLCNGTELRYERSDFRDGDELFLYFRSPVNGYLAIYLLSEQEKTVYCLLPYIHSEEAVVAVKRDNPYIFFSDKFVYGKDVSVDGYTMTCTNGTERNELFVIFSTHLFGRPNSVESPDGLPRQLSYVDFQKWLEKSRRHDTNMQVKRCPIVINK